MLQGEPLCKQRGYLQIETKADYVNELEVGSDSFRCVHCTGTS